MHHPPSRPAAVCRGQVVWPLGPDRARVEEEATLHAGSADPFAPPDGPAEGRPVDVEGILCPAFCDWHFHWVQDRVKGVRGTPLLEWLREEAWPEERRMADAAYAREAARAFRDLQVACGTLAGACWAAPDPVSVRTALEEGVRASLVGPAAMTDGEPDYLLRPRRTVLEEMEELHGEIGDRLVVSPRFALSCSMETLEALADGALEHDLWIQTHLAENEAEVARVAELFPDARSYLDVYDRAGLLGPRTLLGHCIHLDDEDWDVLETRGAVVAHCPTSNVALGSGRMPLEELRARGIPWVLGSDIGAGPHPCMLDVAACAREVHADASPLTAVEAFWRSTLAPAALEAHGEGRRHLEAAAPPPPVGLVELRRPAGIARDETDPETILGAVLDAWTGDPAGSVARVWNAEGELVAGKPVG